MSRYSAIVKWNGNHYFYGERVSGSKIRKTEDDKYELYDDEENYVSGIGDFTRHEWVEVIEDSIIEIKEK